MKDDETIAIEQCMRRLADEGLISSRRNPRTGKMEVKRDEILAIADDLAAGRVFRKLREAWAKDCVALAHEVQRGGLKLWPDLHTVLGVLDLPSLEAAADKVLGGGG